MISCIECRTMDIAREQFEKGRWELHCPVCNISWCHQEYIGE